MLKTSNLLVVLLVFVLAGVAIKAQTIAQAFVNEGSSYLGVQTEEVTKDNFSKFGLKEVRGVAVEKVVENSPAKQAGLQDGDVIVRFNGEEISSFRKLTRLIGETAPDHQARLTIVRGGSEREINVTMGKRPAPRFEAGDFQMNFPGGANRGFDRIPMTPEFRVENLPNGANSDVFVWGDSRGGNYVFSSTRQIGVSISSLSKQLGDYFGVTDGKGVLVNNVVENSPAAKAGLKAGDVIVEVEGKSVAGVSDLMRGIAEKKEGEVSLTIIRNRNRQTVRVTLEKLRESDNPFRTSQPGAWVRTVPSVRANSFPRTNVFAAPFMRVTKKVL